MQSEKGSERILVVDDTKTNLQILVQALRDEYKLGVATDGEKALGYVRDHRVDLILLDIMMPGIDGYEVCRRLKVDETTRSIPIIFITAMDHVQEKARGFDLGAVDYITKPFDIIEVKARVRTHLKIEHYQRELERRNQQLEHAQQQLRIQVRELEGIDRLVRYQMEVESVVAAQREVLSVVRTVLRAQQAALYMLDEAGEVLELTAGEAAPRQLNVRKNDSAIARACVERTAQADGAGGGASPLLYGQKLAGVLWVGSTDETEVSGEMSLPTLWRLAAESAVVLNAAQMVEDLESGQLQVERLLDMEDL